MWQTQVLLIKVIETTSFHPAAGVYPCWSFAIISTSDASFGETSPSMALKYCIASPMSHQDLFKMVCAFGFTLTLVSVGSAPGELDGVVEDSSWICLVPLLFPFLLFPIGVDSFIVVSIDHTGIERFAVGFCIVFVGFGTELTICLYHFVFPPGFGGNVWGDIS
jgi:hypothetical protein